MKELELSDLVENANNTTKFLTPLIFNSGAHANRLLKNFGLVNVYIDDYGYKSKYNNCLFFLFEPVDSIAFVGFEEKITGFASFYDYYDIGKLRMYIFRPSSMYQRDIELFKQGRFQEMSKDYKMLIHPQTDFTDVVIDFTKEIFRFEQSLNNK